MPASPDYLVQYGRSAFLGRFTAPAGFSAARGDTVLARTPRGLELGEVLNAGESRFGSHLDAGGELVRIADESDREGAQQLEDEILSNASDMLGELPLSLVDVEVLFGRSAAILHVAAWAACDADPLCDRLASRFGMPVRILDLARVPVAVDPPPSKGCDKPGCGSSSGGGCSSCGTGGGCGTKSCSNGAVKSADELTAYFSDLRAKMEAQGQARTPLYQA